MIASHALESHTLENGRLGQGLIDQYWDDGYLFPLPSVSPQQAQDWRTRFEDWEQQWQNADLPLPLNTYKRVNAHIVSPLAYEIASHPAILDQVEGVLGPDILLFAAEYFIKEPHTKHIVSMHQDLTYWGLGAIDGLVTAWVALSPATPQSGCMDFVKGSHKNPILPHEDTFDDNNLLSRGQEVKVDVRDEDKVNIEIHPGQMSFHHGLTVHGSGPNQSDDRRIACVMRYVRPDVAPDDGRKDHAMTLRGSHDGKNFEEIPVPTAEFAPDAMATYERIRQQQADVLMKGTKKQGLYA